MRSARFAPPARRAKGVVLVSDNAGGRRRSAVDAVRALADGGYQPVVAVSRGLSSASAPPPPPPRRRLPAGCPLPGGALVGGPLPPRGRPRGACRLSRISRCRQR